MLGNILCHAYACLMAGMIRWTTLSSLVLKLCMVVVATVWCAPSPTNSHECFEMHLNAQTRMHRWLSQWLAPLARRGARLGCAQRRCRCTRAWRLQHWRVVWRLRRRHMVARQYRSVRNTAARAHTHTTVTEVQGRHRWPSAHWRNQCGGATASSPTTTTCVWCAQHAIRQMWLGARAACPQTTVTTSKVGKPTACAAAAHMCYAFMSAASGGRCIESVAASAPHVLPAWPSARLWRWWRRWVFPAVCAPHLPPHSPRLWCPCTVWAHHHHPSVRAAGSVVGMRTAPPVSPGTLRRGAWRHRTVPRSCRHQQYATARHRWLASQATLPTSPPPMPARQRRTVCTPTNADPRIAIIPTAAAQCRPS